MHHAPIPYGIVCCTQDATMATSLNRDILPLLTHQPSYVRYYNDEAPSEEESTSLYLIDASNYTKKTLPKLITTLKQQAQHQPKLMLWDPTKPLAIPQQELQSFLLLPNTSTPFLIARMLNHLIHDAEERQLMITLTLKDHAQATLVSQLKRQLEYSLESKRHFIANLNHEFRTPLNIIIGMAELIEMGDNLTEKQVEYLKDIITSGKDFLNVINDILNYSKLESEQNPYPKTNLSLTELATQLQEQWFPAAFASSNELKIILDPRIPSPIITYSEIIQEVLGHLLSNAIKFTSHGTITFELKLHHQTYKTTRIEFRVTDTGIGIDPKDHASIFDPLTKSGSPYVRFASGIGIGLSFCSHLLRHCHSQLRLESSPGKGSSFYFMIDAENCVPLAKTPGVEHIVMIGESRQTRFAKLLTEAGYALSFANELSNEHLHSIKTKADLALINVNTISIDAIHILSAYLGRDFPILAILNELHLPSPDQCLKAGARETIATTANAKKLIRTIEFWLKQDKRNTAFQRPSLKY